MRFKETLYMPSDNAHVWARDSLWALQAWNHLVKVEGRAAEENSCCGTHVNLPLGPASSLAKAKSLFKQTQMDLKKHTYFSLKK